MPENPDTPVVLTEQVDGVQIVTINRPESRNAINSATAEAIATAMDELDSRDDLTAGIITGAGNGFCAGMDGPLAVRASKEIIRSSRDWPSDKAFERQQQISEPVRSSADAREGALAFKEKRAPVWRGV